MDTARGKLTGIFVFVVGLTVAVLAAILAFATAALIWLLLVALGVGVLVAGIFAMRRRVG